MTEPTTTRVTRISPISGVEHTLDLPVSPRDFRFAMDLYERGALIQNAFYMLSDADREFVKTGITPDEWDETFPDE